MPLTKAQRATLRKALLEQKHELTRKGPVKIEPNRTSEAKVGGDEDEQPLNEMLQSIASARNRNLEGVIGKVERALRKLDEDEEMYGVCDGCDEDIAFGRLKAMPWAELCVTCQAKQDAPKGGPTRKKLTDYT